MGKREITTPGNMQDLLNEHNGNIERIASELRTTPKKVYAFLENYDMFDDLEAAQDVNARLKLKLFTCMRDMLLIRDHLWRNRRSAYASGIANTLAMLGIISKATAMRCERWMIFAERSKTGEQQ